jgi:hypothetical protein
MTLPKDAQERKDTPVVSGVLDYFPDALAEVARVSKVGNDQHNPGQPLHWAKEKSTDEADALVRHLMERGTLDTDGTRHSAKVAWRALALLQRELEAEAKGDVPSALPQLRPGATVRLRGRGGFEDAAGAPAPANVVYQAPPGTENISLGAGSTPTNPIGRVCDCHKHGRA